MSIGSAVDAVEFVNNYDENSDSLIQYSNRTVALGLVSWISGVVLAVVAIVGFVLLRRKVSNNRFSELK